MKPDNYQLWLNAGLDSELDVGESIVMQAELALDPKLKKAWDRQQLLRKGIREGAVYHVTPDALRARLTSSLDPEPPKQKSNDLHESGNLPVNPLRRRWGLALASALVSSLLTWGVTNNVMDTGIHHQDVALDRIAEDAVAGHIRAMMTDRLIDVASSDQHTVKPWLTAHLTYTPPVPDLSAQGFVLVGARRDVIDGQTAATLVYKRRQHVISTYIRPVSEEADIKTLAVRGFNVIRAFHHGMEYWVVSDLNARELGDFMELVLQGK